MITAKTQEIFNILKDYIIANSQYKPLVLQKVLRQTDKFPLVTFIEEDNTDSSMTIDRREKFSNVAYEINIYAVDIKTNNKTISNVNITNELKGLVDNIMGAGYGFKRTSCRPTPNLDSTIYRITMRYEGKLFDNKNRVI